MNKKILFFFALLLYVTICNGQNNFKNLQDMKIFNEKEFENWEIAEKSTSDYRVFLKKERKRITISYIKDEISIKETFVDSPYIFFSNYDRETKQQILIGQKFYSINFGIWKYYDKNGTLIIENNEDNNYRFSIKDIIEKVKKQFNIDLEKKIRYIDLDRWRSTGSLFYMNLLPSEKKSFKEEFYYDLSIPSFDSNNNLINMIHYIIDGQTGETLYKTERADWGDKHNKSIIDEFLEYREENKRKTLSKTTTFQGKTYTEEEWKAFEQEQWEKYQAKRNHKSFWDKLFG